MSREDQITVITAQPDWFVIYKKISGEEEGLVERAGIIGWQVTTEFGIPGPISISTPITVSEGDWLGCTATQGALESNGWVWETAHLPGGRRHQWEIEAAVANRSNRPPDWVPPQTTL